MLFEQVRNKTFGTAFGAWLPIIIKNQSVNTFDQYGDHFETNAAN